MHLRSQTAYRSAAALSLVAALLIVWLNAAAGLIGIEDDDPANLLYVGVLAIGFVGAIMARFRRGVVVSICRAGAIAARRSRRLADPVVAHAIAEWVLTKTSAKEASVIGVAQRTTANLVAVVLPSCRRRAQ